MSKKLRVSINDIDDDVLSLEFDPIKECISLEFDVEDVYGLLNFSIEQASILKAVLDSMLHNATVT